MVPRGVGVGYRKEHYQTIESMDKIAVDWFEVVSENFLDVAGPPKKFLSNLVKRFPIAAHGVGLSVAGADPLNKDYLESLKKFVKNFDPFLVSDHLCWSQYQGKQTYDLLPILMNDEVLDYVCSRVAYVQDFLGRQLVLENPTVYLDMQARTYSEAEFLKRLCERTGCALLLDLNNLIVNHKNLGWEPEAYFDALDEGDVVQFHLAGHSSYSDIHIDTHVGGVPEEVWSLFTKAIEKWPQAIALIEWDTDIPDFSVLLAEADKAREIQKKVSKSQSQSSTYSLKMPPVSTWLGQECPAPKVLRHQIENIWKSMRQEVATEAALENGNYRQAVTQPQRALSYYAQAYYMNHRDALRDSFPLLHHVLEDDGFDWLCENFLRSGAIEEISIANVGRGFADYIGSADLDFAVDQAMLASIARIEWHQLELFWHDCQELSDNPAVLTAMPAQAWESLRFLPQQNIRLVESSYDVFAAFVDFEKGREVGLPEPQKQTILICRNAQKTQRVLLENTQLWRLLDSGATFPILVEASDSVEACLHTIADWMQRGLIASLQSDLSLPLRNSSDLRI